MGAAWTGDETPRLAWDPQANDRVPVASAGVVARMLLGPLVIQFIWAYPFQRPGSNGEFSIEIFPGW